MRTLLLALAILLTPLTALGQAQTYGQLKLGWDPDPSIGTSSLDLNAATTLLAFGFIPNQAETISKVKVYIAGVTSTPASGDLQLQLRADSSGAPAAAATESQNSSTAPTAATMIESTGFTTALTAGTQYWIVAKNINASPSTVYFTVQYIRNGAQDGSATGNNQIQGGEGGGIGIIKYTNDGSGTNWSSGGNNPVPAYGIRIEFASGRFLGFNFTNAAADTTNTIFGARVGGVKFTTPAASVWPTTNAACFALQVGKAGTTPASGLVYKVFSGSSTTPGAAVCTSRTMPAVQITSNPGYLPVCFSSSCVLSAATTYRLVAAVQNATDGTSGNDFRFYQYSVENDANSKAQLPFGGAFWTYSTDGVTFTDSDGGSSPKTIPFLILPDTTSPFTVSGGGIKNQNQVNGGAQ